MSVKRRQKHGIPWLPQHPRPWSVQGPIAGERATNRFDGRPEYSNILDRHGYYVVEMLHPDVAELIVRAVNDFESLHMGGPRTANAAGCKHQSVTAGETAILENGRSNR